MNQSTRLLILNTTEVERLLPMPECIDAMADALSALTRGESHQPLRTIFQTAWREGRTSPDANVPRNPFAIVRFEGHLCFPGNAALGKDAHQGGVLLFDGGTGELLALVNASAITAIRTAAVSALATRLLARADAGDLALIGAGVQARSHVRALACVRNLRQVRVAARRFASAQQFAQEMQPEFPFRIEPVESVAAAVRDAEIIVTATTSREPVLRREWISKGTHINAIGTFSPKARELDTATMAESSLFVDRRESALNEAGDYLMAAAEGAIGPEHIRAELGEVLTGLHPGRTASGEITIFKSLGLAVEDLAAAAHVYQNARSQNAGTSVEF